MRTASRLKTFLILVIIAGLAVAGFYIIQFLQPEEIDPHAGQVLINDGFEDVWITPIEGVEVNKVGKESIVFFNGVPEYVGADYTTLRGIDVSEYQGEIDWSQAAQGLDFAMIRAARRGYTEGGLYEDSFFEQNITAALENGLQVGVYVFSQAITVAEALEEANFVISLLDGYEISLPVVFDWETVEDETARTHGIAPETLNDCAVAFCEKVKAAGYSPAVYFNRQFGYYKFDLARLVDYDLWLSVPGDWPDFYYAAELWQYSFAGSVSGIEGNVDMDMMFVKKVNDE